MTAEELSKILDELGERLGPAGEHVFQITMQRVAAEAIVSIVFGMVVIPFVVVLWQRAMGLIRTHQDEKEGARDRYYSGPDLVDKMFPRVLVAFALGFPFAWGVGEIYFGILKLTTLEYSTLYRLLEALP